MVYVGVDLHRRVSQISAMDEQGEVVLARRIRTEPLEFLRAFGELEPEPMSVAFEATFGWAGSPNYSRTPALPPIWLTRVTPRQSPMAGSRTMPSMPRPWRICSELSFCPRPGWRRWRFAKPAAWSGCGEHW